MARLEEIRIAVLLERDAVDLGLKPQLSMLLVAVLDQCPYCLLVRDHVGHDLLLLLGAQDPQICLDLVPVFVEMDYCSYASRVNVTKFAFLFFLEA